MAHPSTRTGVSRNCETQFKCDAICVCLFIIIHGHAGSQGLLIFVYVVRLDAAIIYHINELGIPYLNQIDGPDL
jgi:hypothetical protein